MSLRKRITYSSHSNHAARSAHARGEKQFKTYDTSHIRPKKSKAPLVVGAVLALVVLSLALGGGFLWIHGCSSTKLAEGQTVELTIPEGSGAKAIGSLLQEKGVIADANEFVSRVNDLDVAAELKPGTYVFKGGMTLDGAISVLRSGPTAAGVSVTIPEGFTLQAIAKRVADVSQGRITAEDFLACAQNASAYTADFPFVADAYHNSLEGFLFPKTYLLAADTTADSLIRMMLSQYQVEIGALDYSYAKSKGLSSYDVLVLASIIEKEASASNRATVASVFYNRLANNMPLQSDATTAYVVGHDPTAEDITQDSSPYSTYANKGLPPGPICSPGLDCLQAACAPENTNYYYFYFKEENGSLVYSFSETYEDHNNAIFS